MVAVSYVARLGLRVRTPALGIFSQLERRLTFLRNCAAQAARVDPIDICFPPFELQPAITRSNSYDPSIVIEELHRLAALGVTWTYSNAARGRNSGGIPARGTALRRHGHRAVSVKSLTNDLPGSWAAYPKSIACGGQQVKVVTHWFRLVG